MKAKFTRSMMIVAISLAMVLPQIVNAQVRAVSKKVQTQSSESAIIQKEFYDNNLQDAWDPVELILTCPYNIDTTMAVDECGNYADYTPPEYPVGATLVINGLGSGSFFPVGANVIEFVVTNWNPEYPMSPASCAFYVNVHYPPGHTTVFIAPAPPVSINLDAGKNYATNAVLPHPTYTDECGLVFTNNAPDTLLAGIHTVIWTVHDAFGTPIACPIAIQMVTVIDNEPPVFTFCPSAVTVPPALGLCTAVGVNLGFAIATDNDQLTPLITNNAPLVFPIGYTTVTWTATDASGNTATCLQQVLVTDNVAPSISCPGDIQVNTNTGSCAAINVNLGTPVYSDNCSSVTVSNNAPSQFPLGQTTVVWTAIDEQENTATCSQLITVIDNEHPQILCPLSVSAVADPGVCQAFIVIAEPLVNDNCGIANFSNNFTGTSNASGNYNVGTTPVLWTVTDIHGLTSTCLTNVIVTDNQHPGITSPADIIVNASTGSCQASISDLGTPVTNDNCGVASTVNNGTSSYAIGVHQVTWTVTDVNGNTSTAVQTVTVRDVEPPAITCVPALTILMGPSMCAVSAPNIGTPQVTDNCQSPVVTNNAPAVFSLGTTIVTWTATDASGNATSCTQLVTIVDNQVPTISCPANVQRLVDQGSNFATGVDLGNPVVSDNCTSGMVVANNAPLSYPVGNTIVTWTVTDAAGNSAQCYQTVTITDCLPPTIICPDNAVFCIASGDNLVVNDINPVVTENCPYTLSYTLTGATTGSGNCTAEGGISGTAFNVGVTTVTYTVTRINDGLSVYCQFTITVGITQFATISSNSIEDMCNGVRLTAEPYSEDYSYQWSSGETLHSIFLSSDDLSGTYTVTVSGPVDACISAQAASFTYDLENSLSAYTILAFSELQIGDYNEIQTGSAGLMDENHMAHFKRYSKVNGPGSFVKADAISAHSTSVITTKIYSPATADLPAFNNYVNHCISGTVCVPDYATMTITNNNKNLNIGRYCNVTLTGNSFGTININKGSNVTFTASTIDLQNLDAKMCASSAKTYLHFTQDADLRVKTTFRLQENCVMNPENNNIMCYIGTSSCTNPGELEVFPLGTTFNASAYVPYGQIHVQHDASSCNPGHMVGKFIAEKVISCGKYVHWNWRTCNPTPYSAVIPPSTFTDEGGDEQEVLFNVLPNPFHENASIEFQLSKSENVDIELYNMIGEKVSDIFHQQVAENSPIRIDVQGSNLNEPGIYLLKVMIGSMNYSRRIVYMR